MTLNIASWPRTFLHSMFIDFNSFFASVEQVDSEPDLRDRPVVVVPLLAETTCCIAASRQAKPFGIKTGTPVHEARRLCPDLEVIEARPELYIRCHKKMHEIIEECGVSAHIESIDEVHCPLWGEWMEVEAARRLAVRIKTSHRAKNQPAPDLFHRSGPQSLPGQDRQRHAKARRPRDDHARRPAALPPPAGTARPLRRRPRMEARLRAHQIDTVEHLCAASREMLREIWGGVEGERFHAALHGQPTFTRTTNSAPSATATSCRRNSATNGRAQRAAPADPKGRDAPAFDGPSRGRAWASSSRSAGGHADWSDEVRFAETQDTHRLAPARSTCSGNAVRPGRATHCSAWAMNLFSLKEEKNERAPAASTAAASDRRPPCWQPWTGSTSSTAKTRVYFAGAHGALEYTPMRIAFTRIPDPDTER